MKNAKEVLLARKAGLEAGLEKIVGQVNAQRGAIAEIEHLLELCDNQEAAEQSEAEATALKQQAEAAAAAAPTPEQAEKIAATP